MKAHENPFSASAVARLRYRMGPEALRCLAERACGQIPVCAVVGPKGTGKTTLLEDLEAPLRDRGRSVHWIRLNRQSNLAERRVAKAVLAELRPGDCCLFDGGEIFSAWEWWQLRRRLQRSCGQVIASLHSPRGVPVLHRTGPDWSVVRSMVRELSGPAAGDELESVARESFLANAGNAREVFRSCYWACARREIR